MILSKWMAGNRWVTPKLSTTNTFVTQIKKRIFQIIRANLMAAATAWRRCRRAERIRGRGLGLTRTEGEYSLSIPIKQFKKAYNSIKLQLKMYKLGKIWSFRPQILIFS